MKMKMHFVSKNICHLRNLLLLFTNQGQFQDNFNRL